MRILKWDQLSELVMVQKMVVLAALVPHKNPLVENLADAVVEENDEIKNL
jgi:hypothetical protein